MAGGCPYRTSAEIDFRRPLVWENRQTQSTACMVPSRPTAWFVTIES